MFMQQNNNKLYKTIIMRMMITKMIIIKIIKTTNKKQWKTRLAVFEAGLRKKKTNILKYSASILSVL